MVSGRLRFDSCSSSGVDVMTSTASPRPMRSSHDRSTPTRRGSQVRSSSSVVSSRKSVADSSPGRRQQPVVDVQLVLDLLVGDHLLGPGHLLHLEPHGQPVLEGQGDHRPDADPPELLHGDDLGPELVPLPLVGALVGDVVEGERSGRCHGTPFWRSASPGVPGSGSGGDPAERASRPMAWAGAWTGTIRPRRSPGAGSVDGWGAGAPRRAQVREASPSLNRPAWLFSARASVSSHSAISSKPSSRAVLANPGYISEYS